jgi:hypothetical protein
LRLALYKGPAAGLLQTIGHLVVCVFTRSRYSHVELVIEGVCWSSSFRDGGVRAKRIDLQSGHWDVLPIAGDKQAALAWFRAHEGQGYDWAGVARFAFRWLPQGERQWFCSEACAAALGHTQPEAYAPSDLHQLALKQTS